MNILTALRAANIARQAEWDPADQLPLAFRIIELGGEVGEALNLVKKLERERLGLKGSRATPAQLGEELADVVICADLVAMAIDGDLGEGLSRRRARLAQAKSSLLATGEELLIDAGYVAACATGASAPYLVGALNCMIATAFTLACLARIDLDAAVVAKFNATSEKVGLKTRLDFAPESAVAP